MTLICFPTLSMAGLLVVLMQLRRQITAATRQFRCSINGNADVKRLTTLPGVSTVLAYTLAAEIGRIPHIRQAGSR